MLLEARNELAEPLSILFTKSLANGELPRDWKEAYVTPIYKKGCKHNPGNYRPVSLTSVLCKLMETILRDVIMKHMEDNQLLSPSQHGFRSGRSTVTQLLESLESWTSLLDKGRNIDIVYCDFQKAFDSVPHMRLLKKIENYGIRGQILKWIKSFLLDRRQKVRVNNALSDWTSVTSGIPQGSVLGPILFILFINDLPQAVNCGVEIYADDTKIFARASSKEEHDQLQRNIDEMYAWSELWQLTFHPDKCHVMHMGPQNEVSKQPYWMGKEGQKTLLQETMVEKDLGVHVDNSLLFDTHCQKIASAASYFSSPADHLTTWILPPSA